MNIAGKTVSMEIDVASNFVTVDDSNSFSSGLDIEVGMFTTLAVSGSTVSYTSTSISDSLYTNLSNNVIGSVTAATITASFQSYTNGSPVSGSISLNVTGTNAPSGPVQGTFTGTVSAL
jgi:hypothetical protein